MRTSILGLASAALLICGGTASAQEWKDGRMFVAKQLTTTGGNRVQEILFGLDPGKCTQELTAVYEWIKMTEGTMTQTFAGGREVVRNVGDEWVQEKGAKVVVCNKSSARAILTGVQIRPEPVK